MSSLRTLLSCFLVVTSLVTMARADVISLVAFAQLVSQPHTILTQIVPDVAVAPTGETLIAGCEVTPANTTTLRLYFRDRAGQQVTATTVTSPGSMRLMRMAAGPTAFMVVWDATGVAGDPTAGGIYFLTYTLTGSQITNLPIQANSLTNLDEWRPSATGYPNGSGGTTFAVIWSRHGVASGNPTQGVYVRRFSQGGAALDPVEVRVDTTLQNNGRQDATVIAGWPDGRLACVWQDGQFNTSALSPDGSGVGVLARVLNANLSYRTGQFVVNATTANDQFEPAVSVDLLTTMVVGWCGETSATVTDAYCRRFNDAATPIDPTDINLTPTNNSAQFLMGIAMSDAGEWTATWQDSATPGYLGSRNGFARYAPATPPLQVETGLLDPASNFQLQNAPRVACDQYGAFQAAWTADDGTNVALRTVRGTRTNLIVPSLVPVGQSAPITLDCPAAPGLAFQLGASFTTGPTSIAPRTLNLAIDDLFLLSVLGTAPTVFSGFSGVLDATGRSSAPVVNVPNYPPASGAVIHLAFVALDPAYPLNVRFISDSVPLAIF